MRFRPGHALGHQLALQVIDQFAVFRMHGRYGTQFQAAFETGDQGIVGRHDGVLVGHEVLEAVDPVLADQFGHFLAHLLAPPGDGDMKTVVCGGLLGPAAPLVKRFEQGLLGVGNHEVDDRGGAAGQARGGAAVEVFAGHRAHEGQLHVGMRVDAAGHQVLAAAIEHFAACGNFQVVTDGFDQAIGTEDIGAVTFIMGNYSGATDQQRHSEFLAGKTGLCQF